MIEKIQKRNGQMVAFDSVKILNAISRANMAVEDEVMDPADLSYLTQKVCSQLNPDEVVTVEHVQDVVEETLIRFDYAKTAKAYILYRAEHTKIRQTESDLMDIYSKLTYSSAMDEDIKRENANIDGDTAMGTMLKYGSEGAKYFVDNYVLPKDIAAAHINGDIHIHDKDFYMLTETCCQIDLIKLFKNGFSTGHGHLREPQCSTGMYHNPGQSERDAWRTEHSEFRLCHGRRREEDVCQGILYMAGSQHEIRDWH